MARILVTGANGQLAPAIVARLQAGGHVPVLLMRPTSPTRSGVVSTLVRILPAPWSTQALRDILVADGIEGVVNLAAAGVRPRDNAVGALYEANVALPVELLRAGAGHVRAFVNIGSGAEYAGTSPADLNETAALSLVHAYGMSKAAGGVAGMQVAAETGCAFAHLRLFGAYGENEAAHRLLPNLTAHLLRDEAVPLSDGLQIRDWLYEEDIAAAVVSAFEGLDAGTLSSGFYNLGSGSGTSVRDFAQAVADALGKPRSLLAFGEIPRRGNEVDRLVANTALFCNRTSWRPTYDLRRGISIAVDRYLARHGLAR